MGMSFRFRRGVTEVYFGLGALGEVGGITNALGRRAVVLTGRHAMRVSGMLDRLEDSLRVSRVDFLTIECASSPSPLSDEVDRAVIRASDFQADVVIGLGGGGAIDCAKALAVGMMLGPIGPLVGTTLSNVTLPPVIAIPTTAGTGSEVTKAAIIYDPTRCLKAGIRSEALIPTAAIVDPDLLLTVPHEVALDTAFDALSHAIEPYVSRSGASATAPLTRDACRLLAEAFPAVIRHDLSSSVRRKLSMAALIGGMNVLLASTCLPHRIQQAIGSISPTSASHGRGLAALYPSWLRQAYSYAPQKFDEIGRLLGHESTIEAIDGLLDASGLRTQLRSIGLSEGDLVRIAEKVTGNLENDPIDNPKSSVPGILTSSW